MSISVLIVGAGGAFGQPLLEEFIRQRSSFNTIAVLASNKQKRKDFAGLETQGIKIISGSFLDSNSYIGYTHVISVVGNPVLRLQPAMIEAAVQAGVTHFYPSEWNSDISQKEIYSMRYFRDKQVTRSHLAATAKRHPAFKYTLFITGIFTEWSVLEFYGFDHEKLKVSVYGEPNAIVGVTSIPDIARYTVASLLIPFKPTTASGSERTIRVEGERTIFQSLVDSLGAAKSVTYETVYLPVADAAAKQEVARLDGNEENEMMWSIRPLIASGFGTAGSTLDNELFDFAPETIQATFQRIYST